MITLRKSQLLILMAVACVFSAAYGQKSEQPKRQLQFEISGTISPARHFTEVTHYGYFHLVEDRRFDENWTHKWITLTSQWKEMSEKQRQFILKMQNDYQYRNTASKRDLSLPFSTKSDYVTTPEGTVTYRVLGVSEEDVRKMAEAVIERLDNQAHSVLEGNQKRLDSSKNIIPEAEKMLPELEIEYKQVEAKAEEKTKEYLKANYEIDRIKRPEIFQHAIKNMEELARYMKLANFELIGLQARMDSIDKFKTSGNISDPGTMIKLDQMLIADEVERAGILARRKAYETSFKQSEELYNIIKSRDDAAIQKLKWQEKLEKAKNAKISLERALANPPKGMQPVEVYENKVFIWQVKQD